MPSKNLVGNTFIFKGINNKEFTLSPMTLEDWGNFVRWVQYKPYIDAEAAGLSKERLDAIYENCKLKRGYCLEVVGQTDDEKDILESFEINFNSTIVQEALASQDGVNHILLISLQKKHKIIGSISEVFSIDPDKNPELSPVKAYNKILELSDVVDSKEEEEEEENPTSPNSTTT